VKIPSEKNPQRPMATWERFDATRRAIQTLAAEAKHASDRLSWVRVEFALVLMEATGRRRGSIRQLAWKDVDFTHREIHWRAETDKKGREWITPVPGALLEEMENFRQQLGLLSPWVFPAPRNPSKPVNGNWLSKRIRRAEQKAKLPKLRGGLCHPYRRKWATERKHFPLKDVAAAGGWKNVNTLLTCYQHEDRETMLLVMTEPRKLTASITLDRKIRIETDSQTDPRGPKQQAPHNVSRVGPST
jgi:integrase